MHGKDIKFQKGRHHVNMIKSKGHKSDTKRRKERARGNHEQGMNGSQGLDGATT